MSEANAWLLGIGAGVHVAVGKRELQYLLTDTPSFTTIPRTPVYCNKVLIWHGAIMPVMDIAQRVLGRNIVRPENEELIVIATFYAQPDAPLQRGALVLDSIPIQIEVKDDQICTFPEPKLSWKQIAQSCFKHKEYDKVPILDLSKVFLTSSSI